MIDDPVRHEYHPPTRSTSASMRPWTQYDEDIYRRLPPGLERIGYDADTEECSFTGGWKSIPYCEYGALVPVDANTDMSKSASTSLSPPQELAPALKALLNPALPRRPSEISVSDSDPKESLETVVGDSDLDPAVATLPNETTASLSSSDTEDGSSASLRRKKTWKEKVQDLPTRLKLKSSGSQLKRSLSSSSGHRRAGITIEQDTPPTPPKSRHSPDPTSPSRTISFSDLGLIKARDL